MNQAFIERHGLWSAAQGAETADLRRRVEADRPRLIRVVWADTRGSARPEVRSNPEEMFAPDAISVGRVCSAGSAQQAAN